MMPDLLTLAVGAVLGALVAGPWAIVWTERRYSAVWLAQAAPPRAALLRPPLYGLPDVTPDPLTASERMHLAAFRARCGGRHE